MKRMEIKEIQAVNLEILARIDRFCRERGIRYFLDSGTLLGAARDGGFIPWDDDADVVMPRSDYERFVAEYADSDDCRLYAPSRGNCFLPYARLCETRRTYFRQIVPWTRESPGVGVDVFPLDGAPATAEEYDALARRIVKFRNRIWVLRSSLQSDFTFRSTPSGFLKDCAHCLAAKVRRLIAPGFFIARNIAKMRALRLSHPYETSSNCFCIIVNSSRGKFWRREWFDEGVEVDLCGSRFMAPAGFDERLSAEYGDWRKPPPESERTGHIAFQTMWWRD